MPDNSLSRHGGRSRKNLDTTESASFEEGTGRAENDRVISPAPQKAGAESAETEFVRPFYNSYMPSDPHDPYLEPDD